MNRTVATVPTAHERYSESRLGGSPVNLGARSNAARSPLPPLPPASLDGDQLPRRSALTMDNDEATEMVRDSLAHNVGLDDVGLWAVVG